MILGMAFMIYVYKKVKVNKLAENESIFWMIGGLIVFILGIFPDISIYIANILKIEYAPSLVFLMGILFCLGVIFRMTIHISLLKEQVKSLAQLNSILQVRIEKLENDNKISKNSL